MPIQKRQQELLEQYKFECNCPECIEGKRANELRRSVECVKSGCDGYVPLPGEIKSYVSFLDVYYGYDDTLPRLSCCCRASRNDWSERTELHQMQYTS